MAPHIVGFNRSQTLLLSRASDLKPHQTSRLSSFTPPPDTSFIQNIQEGLWIQHLHSCKQRGQPWRYDRYPSSTIMQLYQNFSSTYPSKGHSLLNCRPRLVLLKPKASKMLVRQEMQGENGNTVLSKDLSNISAKGKDAAQRNNLLEVVRVLQREITQASLDRREQCLASYLLPRRSNEEVFP